MMPMFVKDALVAEDLLAARQACGGDRYDEVWEGVYMMNPMPNDEHQDIVMGLAGILQTVVSWQGLGAVRPGINLSDRNEGWIENYRVPDVAVFLDETAAVNCSTHWRGAADLLIEVASPGDDTQTKISFYSGLGVRELLIVNRDPWMQELFRFQGRALRRTAQSNIDASQPLHLLNLLDFSAPLQIRLLPGEKRPQIEVVHANTEQLWVV